MADKKAELLAQISERYDTSARKAWLQREQTSYDFRWGDQLSNKQKKTLQDSGFPDFIIDMISPQVRMLKYFITAGNPRWNAVGVEGSDIDIAFVFSSMIDYFWYISSGKLEFSKIIENTLTRSVGIFHLYEDPDLDQGMGEVVFESLEPINVKVDPASTDLLWRDAGGIMVEYKMARYQLMNKLPKFKNQIKAASSGSYSNPSYSQRDLEDTITSQKEDYEEPINPETSEDDDMLAYRKFYTKIRVPFVKLYVKIPPDEEEIEVIQNEVDAYLKELTAEIEVQTLEKLTELKKAFEAGEIIEERFKLNAEKIQEESQQIIQTEINKIKSKLIDEKSKIDTYAVPEKEYKELIKVPDIKDNIVYKKDYFETKIKQQCAVEDKFLYERTMNISEYPVIGLPFEHTGTPQPCSAVDPLKGKQQEITRAHQILIHHANVSSNATWLAPKGMIDDKKHWEQYGSSASAVLEYNDDGTGRKPERSYPLPLNNAFFTLVQAGKQDIEYQSLINSSMMGDATKQPEPYRGMLANDEFGSRQIKSWMTNTLNPVLEHVGKVYQQMSQNFYTFNKVFRIVQPNTVGDLEAKEVEINNPIYGDYKTAIGKYNDYSSAKFDVRFIGGSTEPINRWALLQEYERYVDKKIISTRAFLVESDLPHKEKLIEEMDQIIQLQRAVEERDNKIEQLTGDVETLSRQNLQKDIKVKSSSIETELRKDAMGLEKDMEVASEKITLHTNQAIKEIDSSKKE